MPPSVFLVLFLIFFAASYFISTKSVCLSTFTAYGCGLFLAPLMTTSHSLGVYIRWCFRAFSIVACIESTSI